MPTINVPGIGEVFADGFAEEQTMNRILAVLQSSDNANSPEAQQRLAASANASASSISLFGKRFEEAGDRTKDGSTSVVQGFRDASDASFKYSRTMRQASSNVVSSFSAIEKKPFALAQSINNIIGGLADGSKVIGGIFGGFMGNRLASAIDESFEGAGTAIGAAIGAVAPAAISAIAGFLMEKLNSTSEAFMGVQKAGGIFGGSLINFRDNAHLAGLTMSEFTSIISQNSEAVASFGGQTNRGAREFARANQRLVELEGRSLLPLGVSFQDMGTATAELMQKFADAGIPIERIGVGTAEFATATANQIRQQKMLAAITGRTIDQQKEAERQQRKDVQVQAAIRRLGPQQQAEIQRLITAFPQMRDVILDTVTFGDTVSKGALLAQSAMPNMTDAFIQGSKDIMSGSTGAFESLSALSQNSDVIQGELDNMDMVISQISRFTNNELVKTMEASFLDFRKLAVGAMNKTGRDIVTDMAQVGSESNKATNALIDLQVENRKLAMNLSTLTTQFLANSSGIVGFLGAATGALNDGIAKLKDMAGITPGTNVGGFNTEVLGNVTTQLGNIQSQAEEENNITNTTGTAGASSANTANKTLTVSDPVLQNQINELTKVMRSTNSRVDHLTTNLT